jgi:HK97 family phage major capsid protein
MNDNLRKLLEQRASVWEQMKAIDAAAPDGVLDAEQRENWDKAEIDLQGLSVDVERLQRAGAIGSALERVDRSGVVVLDAPQQTRTAEAVYEDTFTQWTRWGNSGLTAEQRGLMQSRASSLPQESRAQGTTTTAGGYLIPQGFRDVLIETLKYYGGVRNNVTTIQTSSGNLLPWPKMDDTANVGAILAENTQATQLDLTVGQTQLGAYMYTSNIVLVSLQLLQDAIIDINELVPRKLGERLGRIQNTHFTVGTGSSQPLGIAHPTSVTVGVTAGAGLTPSEATSVSYNSLIALIHSVDYAYRARAGNAAQFMVRDSTLAAVRQLKDTQGHPLWQPTLQAGVPDNLLGYGVITNNDLPAMTANATSILFGDFAAGYVIRDVLGIQALRLEERYADWLQVGFLAFMRSDATIQDPSAYKAYVNASS